MKKYFQKIKSIVRILPGCFPRQASSSKLGTSRDMATSRRLNLICVFTLFLFLAFTQYSYAVGVNTQPTNAGGDTLKSGLVGWWTFDGADLVSNVADKSGSGNTGYMSGFTSTSSAKVAGKLGQALRFDGVNDYVSIGDKLDSVFSGANAKFSINFWIKPGTPSQTSNFILGKTADGSCSENQRQFLLRLFTLSKIEFFWRGSLDSTAAYRGYLGSTAITNTSRWYNVVVTYDGTLSLDNRVSIYVNGVADSVSVDLTSGTPSYIQDGTAYLGIGGLLSSSGAICSPTTLFKGAIDDVRIYNRVLSISEIKQLYNQGGAKLNSQPVNAGGDTLKSGLVGWWSFDGADIVNNVVDKSGSGNTGYMQGFTSTSSAKVAGKLGQALKFDGVNDFVKVTNQTPFNFERTNSFSSFAWIKTNHNATVTILGKLDETLIRGWQLVNVSDGTLRVDILNTVSSNHLRETTSATIANNKWRYVGFTYDGSSTPSGLKLYIDGIEVSTSININNLTQTIQNTKDFDIGARDAGTYPIRSFIDDVRVYNRVLSASEIKQLYNTGRWLIY